MTIATALVSDNAASPGMAEQAVCEALKKSGLSHATGILLYMTPEFHHHAQQAVTAGARAAQCTQVAGGIASGVFTEAGWIVDRPAVGVMVIGGGISLGHPEPDGDLEQAILSFTDDHFPAEWQTSGKRFGASFNGDFSNHEALVWQQSRLNEQHRCSTQFLGAQVDVAVSCGLKLLGEPLRVERSNGFDLERVSGQPALRSLIRALPPEQRQSAPHELHHLAAVALDPSGEPQRMIAESCLRPLALIAVNADQSVTLSEPLVPGQLLCWGIRQPDTSEGDMRNSVDRLLSNRNTRSAPACALMFSCIGRGPYFYGGDDRDLKVVRERLPNLPVLGAYCTGQIAPGHAGSSQANRLMQNSVVTALISPFNKESHVQPIA